MDFLESKEDKQFRKELEHRQEEAALSLSGKMLDQNNIALDAQVSARILEVNRRFLDWRVSKDGSIYCAEKYPLREPYMDESLCFINEGEEQAIINDIDSLLNDIYNLIKKYEADENICMRWVHEFNSAVMARQGLLTNSRITGKPVKVAKSYYMRTEANISREQPQNNNQPQNNKFAKW